MKTILTKSQAYRRYRLHQKIKPHYRYCPASKTVFVPHSDNLANPDIKELQDSYNYQIQLIIE